MNENVMTIVVKWRERWRRFLNVLFHSLLRLRFDRIYRKQQVLNFELRKGLWIFCHLPFQTVCP